jgi:hypothetical protein
LIFFFLKILEFYFCPGNYASPVKIKISFKNFIFQWRSINELIKLPSLEELTLKFNPLNGQDSLENIRQLVISKLLDLKMFNRTKVLPEERKGADIDYLKKFGKEWIEIENKDKALSEEEVMARKKVFLEEHPSYLRLVESKALFLEKVMLALIIYVSCD